MYNAAVRGRGICVVVLAIGCAPQRDPETLARLDRIEQQLAHIESELAAAKSAPAAAPTAAATPAPRSGPGPEPGPRPEPAPEPSPAPAPERPAHATVSGTVRIEGAYAQGALPSVVALRPLAGHARPHRPGHYQMEQNHKQFAPRVLAVPVGSQVAFPNHDRFFHNVFSLSTTKPFDLGVFNMNMSRDVTFDRPGTVQVLCNLHALMTAYVVVLEEPYFAVTDASGRFTLRDVPPGRYRVRVWNERSRRGLEKDVELGAGTDRLPLAVTADLAPSTPPDKHGKPRSAGY
jgi:plastocyanin